MTSDSAERVSLFVRFMSHVAVGAETGDCWVWTGNKPDGRYGHFSIDAKIVKAHRWIYEFFHGSIPGGLMIRHKCDNPQCVNPGHLEAGTGRQNTADMYERGRNPDRRGIKHPLARLTESDVVEIRRLYECGVSQPRLAERFNVGRSQVGKIVNRQNWRHI